MPQSLARPTVHSPADITQLRCAQLIVQKKTKGHGAEIVETPVNSKRESGFSPRMVLLRPGDKSGCGVYRLSRKKSKVKNFRVFRHEYSIVNTKKRSDKNRKTYLPLAVAGEDLGRKRAAYQWEVLGT